MISNFKSFLVMLAVILLVTDIPFTGGTSVQLAGVAEAQDPPRRRRRGRRPQPPPPTPEPLAKEEPLDEPEGEYLAIEGATIHTITGPVIRGGTVLSKDGKIVSIGVDIAVPDDAQKIDASGHHLYPGLVAFRSNGLVGSGEAEKSQDPFALGTVTGLAAGITSTWNGSRVSKLIRGQVTDLTLRRQSFISISYRSGNPGKKKELREALEKVQEHLRKMEQHALEKQKDPDAAAPDDKWIRGPYAIARSLLLAEKVAISRVSTIFDLREICQLARRFGFKMIIEGAEEAWIEPGLLARCGASVVLTPRSRRDRDESRGAAGGSSIENARILHESGVPFSIMPASKGIALWGLAGRDLSHLPLEAAFAVRGGLPEDVAVESITIEPARMLGVADRVGSIEVGKDADFIIMDGDLLSYMSHVRWAIIDGKVQYDKMEEGLLDHIRPPGEDDPPAPDDHWPRRLGDPL
ncbi:MAG: amidohydrolase family protein [Planctomycetota bacterium]|nr:amidohydrolase family protein [Planctomycetota bacterium]